MSADRLDSSARERMLELLADQAHHGLSPADQAELDRLIERAGGDDGSMERAAAATHLALESLLGEKAPRPLPGDLRAKLIASGREIVGRASTPPAEHDAEHRRPAWAAWTGWIAAAAAAVIAIAGWWPKRPETPTPAPTLAELRQHLVESDPNHVVATFKPGPDPEGKDVSGDLVWSAREQTGYLRFRGLPKNDVSKVQYQLWIFDAKQDERYPIDGGVFDVDGAAGEAIVAIDARLKVLEPKLFAVTLEKPGGVVVSSRDRIVALAQM
jgi:hypothetical protein